MEILNILNIFVHFSQQFLNDEAAKWYSDYKEKKNPLRFYSWVLKV